MVKKSVLAGMFIALGGAAYMVLGGLAGAIMFSAGLIGVCYLGLPLITGKVGYIVQKQVSWTELLVMLGGNLLGAILVGCLIGLASPNLHQTALSIIIRKSMEPLWKTLISAFLCGVLIFEAVEIFREAHTPWGILFAVPVFVVCGFDHCIAYMAYAGAARQTDVLVLCIIIVGNSLGGIFASYLTTETFNKNTKG